MGVVYTVAFSSILKIRSEGFVFYLMLGLLAWTFFASSVAMSTGAIVDNGGLVKSVWFPRAILPTATVLFNLTQYLLSVSVILPLMLIYYRRHARMRRCCSFRSSSRCSCSSRLAWRSPGDRRGVLARRPPPRRDRADDPVLDDADRLRAGATVGARCAARDPPQPDVALRRPPTSRSSTTDSGRTPPIWATTDRLRRRRARARTVAHRPQRRQLRGAGLTWPPVTTASMRQRACRS